MLTRVRGWVARRLFRVARWVAPRPDKFSIAGRVWFLPAGDPNEDTSHVREKMREMLRDPFIKAGMVPTADGSGSWVELPARDVTVTDKGCVYLNGDTPVAGHNWTTIPPACRASMASEVPDSLTITCDPTPRTWGTSSGVCPTLATPKPLTSLADHDAARRAYHLKPYCDRGTGIACPKCGAELHDKKSGGHFAAMILTHPPKAEVVCPACDWSGTRVA